MKILDWIKQLIYWLNARKIKKVLDDAPRPKAKKVLPAEIVTDLEYLKQVSKPTTAQEVEELGLVDRIQYALQKGWQKGYGLAAVQIGVPIRAAWYWTPDEVKDKNLTDFGCGHLLINPEIVEYRDPVICDKEGCLSMPGKLIDTRRYNWVKVVNDGALFMAEGLEAQIIIHEVQHMDGILMTDFEYKKINCGRNEPCPLCGEKGKIIKFKKCKEHFIWYA